MAITKEQMRLLSSKTKCILVTNMWPYTDEEADFLNGKTKRKV